ncbi:MAG: sialidase family protein, partial [Verrucomicrobia bacterium]|nr:sialidase family protein [Verrucomicrobiota bacterium]
MRCLLISILLLGNPVFAAWVKLDPPPSRAAWSSIASSANGSRMGAVVDGGYIWISTDAGATWNARVMAGIRNWKSIAISDNGNRMVATETKTTKRDFFGDIITTYSSEIWISNDGGVTWALSFSRASGYLKEIVITPDGRKIAAVGYGGVLISVDGGVTWTPHTVPAQTSSVSNSLVPSVTLTQPDMTPIWISAAFSNNAGRLWMVGYPHGYSGADQILVSDDDGANWSRVPGLSLFSGKITVSPDGQKVVIASTGYNDSRIWVSIDAGSTWTEQKVAGLHAWVSVAISSDDMIIAAASANGGLWLTRDGGSSWQQAFAAGSRFWCDIACSSDGTQLAAVAN